MHSCYSISNLVFSSRISPHTLFHPPILPIPVTYYWTPIYPRRSRPSSSTTVRPTKRTSSEVFGGRSVVPNLSEREIALDRCLGRGIFVVPWNRNCPAEGADARPKQQEQCTDYGRFWHHLQRGNDPSLRLLVIHGTKSLVLVSTKQTSWRLSNIVCYFELI